MNRPKNTSKPVVVPILAAMFLSVLCVAPAFSSQATCEGSTPTPTAETAKPAEAVTPTDVPGTSCPGLPTADAVIPADTTTGSADVDAGPDGVTLDYCPVASSDGTLPDWMANPHRHGTCRCSCGYPCKTDADCGGASCDPFISCC